MDQLAKRNTSQRRWIRSKHSISDGKLWNFAASLNDNNQTVNQTAFEDFFFGLFNSLKEQLVRLKSRDSNLASKLSDVIITQFETGPDYVIICLNDSSVSRNGKQWMWPNDKKVTEYDVTEIIKAFARAVVNVIEELQEFKITYLSEQRALVTISTQDGRFDIDILPALKSIGGQPLLFNYNGTLTPTNNKYAENKLKRWSSDFDGLPEIIRAMKFLAEKQWNEKYPYHRLPSAIFETITMNLVAKKSCTWWNKEATFATILCESLAIIKDETFLPPPNDPNTNLLEVFQTSNMKEALNEWIDLVSLMTEKQLLEYISSS